MHNKKTFDIENEGRSDGAQHPQWNHLTANIFALAFTISEILVFQIFDLEILG